MSDDDSYGPNNMLDDFQNIKVNVGGGTAVLAVNAYRNLSHSLEKGGCQEALQVKDALAQLGAADVHQRAGGPVSYMDVFTGKGSPESIAGVMQTFYDYSDRFIKMFGKSGGPPRKCADWLADPDTSWQDSLQSICHEYIGLDCNGFVGNWLKRCDHSLKLDQNSRPRPVYDNRAIVRQTVPEIEYWDVIIWADFSHIAAIWDEGGGGSPRFYVCQSAGGGPRCNLYEIASSTPGVFQLRGGIPEKDVPGPVYVISLWNA
jgi:hypothetical protein